MWKLCFEITHMCSLAEVDHMPFPVAYLAVIFWPCNWEEKDMKFSPPQRNKFYAGWVKASIHKEDVYIVM